MNVDMNAVRCALRNMFYSELPSQGITFLIKYLGQFVICIYLPSRYADVFIDDPINVDVRGTLYQN